MGASCRRLQPRELMESRKLLEAMVTGMSRIQSPSLTAAVGEPTIDAAELRGKTETAKGEEEGRRFSQSAIDR